MTYLKKRRELPLFCRLKYSFELNKILEQFYLFSFDDYSKYNDLAPGSELYDNALVYREYLHKWFLNDAEIKKSLSEGRGFYGDNYKQLSLTSFDPDKFGSTDKKMLKNLNKDKKMRIVKRSLSDSASYVPEADERNYTKKNENVKGIFDNILSSFKAEVCRTRFAVLMPGFRTATHIDADTDYTIRIHIPIITNTEAVFGIIKNGRLKEIHLPADGDAWFVNAGFPHYVYNGGKTPRVHLIIALNGQEDLPHDEIEQNGIWS